MSDSHFQTLDRSLFTTILDSPLGFDHPFDVFVGDSLLGSFARGSSVNFGAGVSEFSIRGICPMVDSDDPLGFPIKLGFDSDLVSFQMPPLLGVQPVPEPSTLAIFGVLGLAIRGVRRKRKP